MATRSRSASLTRKYQQQGSSGMMNPSTPMAGRRYASHRLSNASLTTTSSYSSYYSAGTAASHPMYGHQQQHGYHHAQGQYAVASLPQITLINRLLNTVELIFTNLIDTLIFTSAIVLTAYRYWVGQRDIEASPPSSPHASSPCNMASPVSSPRSTHQQQHQHHHVPHHPYPPFLGSDPYGSGTYSMHPHDEHDHQPTTSGSGSHGDFMLMLKRQDGRGGVGGGGATTSAASATHATHAAALTGPDLVVTPPLTPKFGTSDPAWSDLKHPEPDASTPQTQSNAACRKKKKSVKKSNHSEKDEKEDDDDEPDEDDRVNRIEETLQALIRQGQEALTSGVDWE
ncbi:hypothetical protein BC940DRAFT_288733 [Gongronella butleri]|nr:hypothetical protein BC940DRAFT_288733 [Gongronella butleri]